MANTFTISGLGFAKLNTTTMPVLSIEYTPNMATDPFRSGGDLGPTMIRRAGAMPVMRFTVPLDAAYSALSSLLPGTLPARCDDDGTIHLHCLDLGTPAAATAAMAAEEARFARAFRLDG